MGCGASSAKDAVINAPSNIVEGAKDAGSAVAGAAGTAGSAVVDGATATKLSCP